MKVYDFAQIIENDAPVSLAYSWDNVGLMVGDINTEVTGIMLTLDVLPNVVEQAIEKGCNLIISHHPLFFEGCKTIDYSTKFGAMIKELINNDISVYSCHTNMDAAQRGINFALAQMFDLKEIEILEPCVNVSECGIGRIGVLNSVCTLKEFCETVKKKLNTPFVRVVNNNNCNLVSKVCVASGSCADMIGLAASKGADVIITGDVKYHQALEADNIVVIDAGHYPTEYLVTDILSNLFDKCSVPVFKAKTKDVFEIV